MVDTIFCTVLFLNGLYDIACWAGILLDVPIVSTLHTSLLANREDALNPALRRVLAHWILTYGIVRTVAGMNRRDNRAMRGCAVMTYVVEGMMWAFEARALATALVSASCLAIVLYSLVYEPIPRAGHSTCCAAGRSRTTL